MPHSTAARLLSRAVTVLTSHGIPNPRLDAEVLLAHVLGTGRADLYARLHDPLPHRQEEAFYRLLQRRTRHEPLQYLTGVREFWSLEFKVDRRVLIPRPETEIVVEAALRLLGEDLPQPQFRRRPPHPSPFDSAQGRPLPQGEREPPVRLLDVGTGSGCIAIALAKELPQAEIWATDISADALAVAKENARCHSVAERIRFRQGDLFAAVVEEGGSFDLIVANPPYIAQHDFSTLPAEVRDWEPQTALDGGPDGLDFYRRLLHEGPAHLRAGGWLIMEIGQGQGAAVMRLIQEQRNLTGCRCVPDYAGRERVAVACQAGMSVN